MYDWGIQVHQVLGLCTESKCWRCLSETVPEEDELGLCDFRASLTFKIRREAPAPEVRPAPPLVREATPRGRSGVARTSGSWDRRKLTDPAGTLMVGEHEDMQQHGARCRTDSVETSAERALDVFEIGHTEEHDLVSSPVYGVARVTGVS